MIEKTCPRCEEVFKVKPCRADRTNYCSQYCYQEQRGQKFEVVCEECGDVSQVIKSRAGRKYCSLSCRDKAYTGQQRVDPELKADKRRAKNRNHYHRHKEEYSVKNREKYLRNRQAISQRRAELTTADRRAAESERAKRWSRNNTEKVRLARNRRRARIAQATVDNIGYEDWIKKLDYYGHACAYCGTTDGEITQDHIIALARGGEHSIDNLVPACKTCNSRKHASSLLGWLLRWR